MGKRIEANEWSSSNLLARALGLALAGDKPPTMCLSDRRLRVRRQQRVEIQSLPLRGHLRRLARRTHRPNARRKGAAHLHDNHPDPAPPCHADARSDLSPRRGLAERGLQPAGARWLLSWRRDATASATGNYNAAVGQGSIQKLR